MEPTELILTDQELQTLIEVAEVNIERAAHVWNRNEQNARRLGSMSERLQQLLDERERRSPAPAPSPSIVRPGGGLVVPGR